MRLICYGSSSSGNGYILEGEKESLMIEAGMSMSKIRKAVPDFKKVVGCIISHRHGDHAKSINDILRIGIPVLTNDDVLTHYKVRNANAISVIEGEVIKIGEFKVVPLPANHDVECQSYLISHPSVGILLFATDTCGLDYNIDNIDYLMLECNYSEECIQLAIDEGRTNYHVAERVRETHNSIDNCIDFIKTNGCKVKKVFLLHLSHENSDPSSFLTRVTEETQKDIYIASAGINIDL